MNISRSPIRTVVAIGAGIALTLAACGGDDDADAPTDSAATPTSAESSAEEGGDAPAMAPSALTLSDQDGDGTSVTIDAVELPSGGFVAVHSDGGGSPGPVIGVSDLLPAGTSSAVVVALDQPLAETGVVFPMIHIDTDGNGIYEFGAVEGVDGPGVTADGDVAVGPVTVTLAADEGSDASGGDEPATQPAAITFEAQESDGTTITVASAELPSDGFIAVHSDGGGSPGPVIGVSDLLPAGVNADVAITLDTPLDADTTLFPMIHIDTDGNGIYEFGAVEGVDGPGVTAGGDVAVVGAPVTVGGGGEGEGAQADATITIADFAFGGITEVPVGTTVVVTNTDGSPHTWTAVDGPFDSGTLGQGESFEFTFTEAGSFEYFCNFHPSMTGTITVTG